MRVRPPGEHGSQGIITLAILAAWFLFGVLSGRQIPMISGDRAALTVLFVIGFSMCGLGIARISSNGKWAHLLTILGCVLGALTMLLVTAGLFTFRGPFVHDARRALIAVAVMIAARLALAILHILIS